MYPGHDAVNILWSTAPTALNRGMLLCLCLVHTNMDILYSVLLLTGGQTTSSGPLVFLKFRGKTCVWP